MIKAVIFDLDDTLYPEISYIKSGFSILCSYLNSLNISANVEEMVKCFSTNASDAIKLYLENIGEYSYNLHNSLLNMHRAHIPNIRPFEHVEQVLIHLKKQNLALGLISDGTPYAQNNKLIGLKLEKYFDYKVYSDSLGGIHCRKPCDVSFRYIQKQMNIDFGEMIYIGDNYDRDFYPCEHLGIIGLQVSYDSGVYFGKKYKHSYTNYYELEKMLFDILEGKYEYSD